MCTDEQTNRIDIAMRSAGIVPRVERAVRFLGERRPTLYAQLETYTEGVSRAEREWWLPHLELALVG